MRNYIIFRLYGAMASWGDIAIGETRNTFLCPTKSAILGLIAAVLGIKRDQENEIQSLQNSIGFAVRIDHVGPLIKDYHTTQVASQTSMRKNKHATMSRKNQLSLPDLNTILSTREYYCDGLYTIILWQNYLKENLISDIELAINSPEFVTYLGRKSFTLGLPIKTFNIYCNDIEDALKKADKEINLLENNIFSNLIRKNIVKTLHWEDADGIDADGIDTDGIDTAYNYKIIKRKDKVKSRKRWQFEDRIQYYKAIKDDNLKVTYNIIRKKCILVK